MSVRPAWLRIGERADLEGSAIEVLDDFEEMWVPSMRAVPLAAEFQFQVADVRLAAGSIGGLYNSCLRQARARQQQIGVYTQLTLWGQLTLWRHLFRPAPHGPSTPSGPPVGLQNVTGSVVMPRVWQDRFPSADDAT